MTVLTGKVFRGALYFSSDVELLKALAPFEGKAVEVVVLGGHAFEARAFADCAYCHHIEPPPKVCGRPKDWHFK